MAPDADTLMGGALERAEAEWAVRSMLGVYGVWDAAGRDPETFRLLFGPGGTADVDGRPLSASEGMALYAGHPATPWLAHTLGPARVDLAGDRAASTHYVRVHGTGADGSVDLLGFGYGRWELARDGHDWHLATSVARSTGRDDALAVLRHELPDVVHQEAESVLTTDRCGPLGPRLQAVRDHLAIANVVATYGLAADGGATRHVGDCYTADTRVDIEGAMFMAGRDEVEAMIDDEPHRSLLPWAGHTMGPALVEIDGDRATATLYARIYGRTTEASRDMADPRAAGDRSLWRFGYNGWKLVREGDGRWRIAERTSRSPRHGEARDLLHRAVTAPADAATAAAAPGPNEEGLERRVRRLEDSLAVEQLLTRFAIALDGRAPGAALSLLAEDCVIERDGRRLTVEEATAPRDAVLGHLVGPGTVVVHGDDAVATQLVTTYRRPPGLGVRVDRLSWDRWEVERDRGATWRIVRHESVAADRPAARDLAGRGIPSHTTSTEEAQR